MRANDNIEIEKKDIIDEIIYQFIVIIMICIPFFKGLSYVTFLTNIDDIFFKRLRAYFLWISIFFLLILYLYSIISKKRKINHIDYLFYILAFLGVISTIFAIDLDKSIFGEANRYEGLLSLFSYYMIALNAKNLKSNKLKNYIINIFLIIGVLQSIIGILQALTQLPYIRRFPRLEYMAMGMCSNPNFFGSYMSLLLSIVSIYFVFKSNVINTLLVILFAFVLYLSGTSGPLLGYLISFIFMAILLRKKYLKMISLGIIVFLSFFISDKLLVYTQTHVFNNELSTKYYIKADLKDNIDKITSGNKDEINKLGSNRIRVWKNTLPLFKRYWLTGAGIDNFRDVYPQSGYASYDKAHNVYLQIGITNGIPALIIYMAICFITFIKGFKLKDKFSLAMYMGFVTYCIQAFANISVIDVAPYFYIVLGFLICKIQEEKILFSELFKIRKHSKK